MQPDFAQHAALHAATVVAPTQQDPVLRTMLADELTGALTPKACV